MMEKASLLKESLGRFPSRMSFLWLEWHSKEGMSEETFKG
jgi:hypothetical protein